MVLLFQPRFLLSMGGKRIDETLHCSEEYLKLLLFVVGIRIRGGISGSVRHSRAVQCGVYSSYKIRIGIGMNGQHELRVGGAAENKEGKEPAVDVRPQAYGNDNGNDHGRWWSVVDSTSDFSRQKSTRQFGGK